MTNVSTDRFRDVLLAERERIQHAVEYLQLESAGSLDDETGAYVTGSVDDHLGDVASETAERELDYSLEDSAGTVLSEIDAALERIDRGTYGKCTACGRPIDEGRLEARPWASLCIDDQRRLERP